MATAEHEALVEALDRALTRMSKTKLLGVKESERRMFDYSCLTDRDFERPLVAQVVWNHEAGLEKDLRTLVYDSGSLLKVLVVRDGARIRARFDEIIGAYQQVAELRRRLLGLKVIFVPRDFNADDATQRIWLETYLARILGTDVGFGIVFGGLTRSVFSTFCNYNGPFGLKYAVLDEIVRNGLTHMPRFKSRLGYKTDSTIRQVLIMLDACGFVRNVEQTNVYFATIRGRFVLDFTRRLLLDVTTASTWSDQTLYLFSALHMSAVTFPSRDPEVALSTGNLIHRNLIHAFEVEYQFGRDLLSGVDRADPHLYSTYDLSHLITEMAGWRDFRPEIVADEESLFFWHSLPPYATTSP